MAERRSMDSEMDGEDGSEDGGRGGRDGGNGRDELMQRGGDVVGLGPLGYPPSRTFFC